jgi:tape measure domain-containing protein
LKSAGDAVKSVGKAGLVVAGAITAAVGAVGGFAIGAAADMEMMGTQFEVMLGSEEKALALMGELRKLAASTPFELADLGQGAQQLLSFGVNAKDVTNTMRMLGDTAGGNAEKLSGLVLAYGKVQTKGMASMEELNMMAERGLPVFDELTKLTGKQGDELFKMISDGDISKDTITKMFQKLTSEGGMFYQGMQKQSLTFNGLVSTMKDSFTELGATIGTDILPFAKEFVKIITDLVAGPLGDLIKQMASGVVPLMKGIQAILPTLLNFFFSIGALVQAFAKDLGTVFQQFSGGGLTEILSGVFNLLKPILSLIVTVIGTIMPVINVLWETLFNKVLPMITNIFSIVGNVLTMLTPAIAAIVGGIEPVLGFLLDVVNVILFITNLILEKLSKPLTAIFTALGNAIADIFGWIGNTLNQLVKDIVGVIIGAIKLINKIPGVNFDIKGLEKMRDEFGNMSMAGITSKKVNAPTVNNITLNQEVKVEQNALKNSSATAVRDAATGATQAAFSEELKKLLIASGA